MKTAQYERILQKLERTSELLQDSERAKRAGRLLVYSSIEELQTDINELTKAFRANKAFVLDTEELFEGIAELDFDEVTEFEFPSIDDLPQFEI